jgi:hypothetical protein
MDRDQADTQILGQTQDRYQRNQIGGECCRPQLDREGSMDLDERESFQLSLQSGSLRRAAARGLDPAPLPRNPGAGVEAHAVEPGILYPGELEMTFVEEPKVDARVKAIPPEFF